jgi:peptide-methionine (R)-S-oxide reductase
MLTRRTIIFAGASAGALIAAGRVLDRPASGRAAGPFEVTLTDEEWRKRLTRQQYAVLRQHATEPPYSSALNDEKRPGGFACAGCDLPLFSSETKFDSRTGWPSFWKPLDNAIGTSEDRAYGMLRTEVHCRRCGGHLGHVFEDGPPPTGLRYCINGLALKFTPAQA